MPLAHTSPLRIGLAGLGTVGIGVVKTIQRHQKHLMQNAGRPIEIVAVSARDASKDRGVDLSGYAWEADPVALAKRPDVDVLVEMIGGHDGPAKDAIIAAIAAKKGVVTANKALLAYEGQALARAAEAAGSPLRFEAAVAGGIPIIKTMTEALAANKITRVMGVMNGTCNYILTRMEATGQGYNALFDECARLGYLEADPNLDVGGIDAGHKLALLASIAFGTQVNFAGVHIEGIQNVSLDDIHLAGEMGYRIKLLGVAQMGGRGLEQRMTPCLVPMASPLGLLDGGMNMVIVEGDSVGQIVLRGAGAGQGPTSSAVMADILDIARGHKGSTFGRPAVDLTQAITARVGLPAPYYLRMTLVDKPGALAKIATCMGDVGVSIDQMRQIKKPSSGEEALVLIVTHKATSEDIEQAMHRFTQSGVMIGAPTAIRIEEV